ncbi:MAG: hypothetical protein R2826_10105 [Thermoleophilia bacterium]
MDRSEGGADGAQANVPGATDGSTPARQRQRPSRRRTRIQRIAILAAVFVVIVFVLALVLRSCQHNRKVDAYRTYLGSVSTAIDDSAALSKQLNQVVSNPTKYSREELIAKLDELSAKQQEISSRAEGFEPPDTLSAEQQVFAEGMAVRAEGFKLFQATVLSSLENETVNPNKVTALAGYFSGPDAYYMSRFYTQTRTIMSEQGVTDVAVPTASQYLTAKTFESDSIEAMLNSVGTSTKLVGRHGVALVGVAAQPENVELSTSKTTDVKASAELAFEARVQNQGDADEANVVVKGEITLPDGSVLEKSVTIESIAAGKTATASLSGFQIPGEALGRVSTLKITAGPVPGESVKTNNSGSFKIQLQLE